MNRGGRHAAWKLMTLHAIPDSMPLTQLKYRDLSGSRLAGAIFRKINRSKKLTRFFLDHKEELQLVALSDLGEAGEVICASLAPPSPIRRGHTLDCIGGPLTLMSAPQDPAIFPVVRVVRVNQAEVFGQSSLIRLSTHHMVHHDLFLPEYHTVSEERDRRLRIDNSTHTCRIVGGALRTASVPRAAAFTDSVSVNYAHWLTEVLPRIILYVGDAQFKGVPLIVDAGLHSNMYESLSMIVDAGRDILLLPRRRRVSVAQLDIVSPTGYVPHDARPPKRAGHSHGIFSMPALEALRSALRPWMSRDTAPRRRLFVVRNSAYRHLINQDRISHLFQAAGFELVCPETLSFSEQVRLFSCAEVVVGATGAAMANLVFCPPGCQAYVIMAQHPDMPYWYWQRMADCVGVDMHYILGEICAAHESGFHADFRVAESTIQTVLEALHAPCKTMAASAAS